MVPTRIAGNHWFFSFFSDCAIGTVLAVTTDTAVRITPHGREWAEAVVDNRIVGLGGGWYETYSYRGRGDEHPD